MKLFVGNLSYRATDDMVRAAFAVYGEVARVQVARDAQSGRAHGFALVDMPEARAAAAARTGLDGHDLDGRLIRVGEARPDENGPRLQG